MSAPTNKPALAPEHMNALGVAGADPQHVLGLPPGTIIKLLAGLFTLFGGKFLGGIMPTLQTDQEQAFQDAGLSPPAIFGLPPGGFIKLLQALLALLGGLNLGSLFPANPPTASPPAP